MWETMPIRRSQVLILGGYFSDVAETIGHFCTLARNLTAEQGVSLATASKKCLQSSDRIITMTHFPQVGFTEEFALLEAIADSLQWAIFLIPTGLYLSIPKGLNVKVGTVRDFDRVLQVVTAVTVLGESILTLDLDTILAGIDGLNRAMELLQSENVASPEPSQETEVPTPTSSKSDSGSTTTLKLTASQSTTSPTPMQRVGNGIAVFVSYAHKDERFRERVDKHLTTLRRQGLIRVWNDRRIAYGDFGSEINTHLETADLILLLVSADFIASEYCFKEMEKALQQHEANRAIVIPIILRPCDWKNTQLGNLLALPKDGKPVNVWPDKDAAYEDIAAGVRRAIGKLRSTL